MIAKIEIMNSIYIAKIAISAKEVTVKRNRLECRRRPINRVVWIEKNDFENVEIIGELVREELIVEVLIPKEFDMGLAVEDRDQIDQPEHERDDDERNKLNNHPLLSSEFILSVMLDCFQSFLQ